ncbi:MAG: glycosyltransferase, partial [Candidatus Omnitrophota bacterium]
KIEGILFQGNVPEEKNIFKIKTSIKNFFLKSAINNNIFDRVLCMSELYYEFLRNKLEGENRKKVGLCPDPCETGKVFEVSEARKSLSLPQGAKIVGMVGTINKRKGADLLIKSFLERNHKDNEFILLAGKQTEDIKKLIRYCKSIFPEKIRHVIEINRFLSQEEFLLAIAAVDAVAVVYPAHFGSSGILIQAAAAKKPVLGSAFSWVGYAIKKYNLGYCCNVCEHAELTKGLEWAFGNPTFSVDGASMLVQQNTNEKFREVILENIRC